MFRKVEEKLQASLSSPVLREQGEDNETASSKVSNATQGRIHEPELVPIAKSKCSWIG